MKKCAAKHLVLKEFFQEEGYSLNAFLISERTDLDTKLAYQCTSSLVLAGYLKLSFSCGSGHPQQRMGDYYEITQAGMSFMNEDKNFCRSWRLPALGRVQWQWRFPYLNFQR
jgi:hypothetical protein